MASDDRCLLVVMNHPLLPAQEAEARERLGVTEIRLPTPEQQAWLAQIDPHEALADEAGEATGRLREIGEDLAARLKPGDVALVQGEFGATVYLVGLLRARDVGCYYATTVRDAEEVAQPDGSVTKRTVFRHVRLRQYPR